MNLLIFFVNEEIDVILDTNWSMGETVSIDLLCDETNAGGVKLVFTMIRRIQFSEVVVQDQANTAMRAVERKITRTTKSS